MNLLIIPSWYPSELRPNEGIFIQEQAKAISELCPDYRVALSLWGHADSELPLKSPLAAVKKIIRSAGQGGTQTFTMHGVLCAKTTTLHWSRALLAGRMDALIEANLRNVQAIGCQRGKIDLIHAHVSYPAGFIAQQLSRKLGIPFVLTEHMSPFPFPAYQRRGQVIPEIRQALNSADRVIAVSPSHAAHIARNCDRPVDVVPNLVDETQFRPDPAHTSEGLFRFLTVGVGPQKGTDLLLKAISLWLPNPRKIEFLIAGGTESQLTEYQRLCQELGIASLVRWLGPIRRQSAPELFKSCNAFVMPSRTESFGISYVEALACGRPVIATRCGGPEWFVNESNGMLVDCQSGLDELIGAMKYMTDNARQFQSQKIRSEFECRFSRRAVVSQISRIYREVLDKRIAGARDAEPACAA